VIGPELYKTATTDQNGHFTVRGITPGGYRAYAWEVIEANAGHDRDVLYYIEPRGSRFASRNLEEQWT